MKILLFGEYSNVHCTLAQGLRCLGHTVVVISDGDGWKNYPRDINLQRFSLNFWGTLKYFIRLCFLLPHLKGYDVVQIINPVFLSLKAERIPFFYRYIRQHNRSLFMGAFGMDYYWVKTAMDCKTFRYSDFNIGSEVRHSAFNDVWIHDWLKGYKGKLNQFVAKDCDGIISGLYEYHCSYLPYFPNKTRFIPFPINQTEVKSHVRTKTQNVRFFIGIQHLRNVYKGTDIMLRALERVHAAYPNQCTVVKVESVPFEEYQYMMNSCDVLLDQLYSYTPAMNALLAMAKGLIVVGGGEPEAYKLLCDKDLHPIINVEPDEESVYIALENLVLHPECISELSSQSIEYINRYHDYVKVATQYVAFWKEMLLKNEK